MLALSRATLARQKIRPAVQATFLQFGALQPAMGVREMKLDQIPPSQLIPNLENDQFPFPIPF